MYSPYLIKSEGEIIILFYNSFFLQYSIYSIFKLFSTLPYRMKIYTEINLATWLRLVKLMELNISKIWSLNCDYLCYQRDISENNMLSGI